MIGAFTHRISKDEIVERYESTTDYVKQAVKNPDPSGSSHKVAGGFTGDVTWDEAVEMGLNGWAEGVEKAHKLTGRFVADVAGRIMRDDWMPDVEGNYVDLGLYVAREPEHWMRPEQVYSEQGAEKRHIRILFNGTVSCAVERNVIEARGAALAALADLLELAGDIVTIDLVYAITQLSERTGAGITQYVAIKAANERVDLGKLMFWLAHPAAMRRLAFGTWEGYAESVRSRYGFGQHHGFGGYGYPSGPSKESVEHEPDLYISEGYVGTPGGASLWTNVQKVEAWLEESLKALGVRMTREVA